MAETVISRKLDEIGLSINSLQNNIVNMQTHITEIRTDAKDTRRAIYGNGGTDAGMMGRVKALEDWREAQIWFQRVAVSALVGEGISMIGLVVYALIMASK